MSLENSRGPEVINRRERLSSKTCRGPVRPRQREQFRIIRNTRAPKLSTRTRVYRRPRRYNNTAMISRGYFGDDGNCERRENTQFKPNRYFYLCKRYLSPNIRARAKQRAASPTPLFLPVSRSNDSRPGATANILFAVVESDCEIHSARTICR